MLDRNTPPHIHTIDRFKLAWPNTYLLKEGIPLFALNMGQQPMVKIELICDAGVGYEPQNGIAYFTANMLQEGTQQKSAQEISRYIEQYGASFYAQLQRDTCTLTLITLTKHLEPMLALLVELLLTPTFPEQRLDHLKHLKLQALKLAAQKNKRVARQKFEATLFGNTHPYGRRLTETAIAHITIAQLRHYYTTQLLTGCRLLVSGKVNEQVLRIITQYMQPLPVRIASTTLPSWGTYTPQKVHVVKQESLQTAICMGKILLKKGHPDYLPLLIINELLGGYFGSRLMSNIREQKGYTYGIGASIVSHQHASYLLIATEVMRDFAKATCQEIVREIRLLQTTRVPDDELKRLKSYMLGAFLSSVDGPFATMEKFKAAHLHGLDQDYYERLYDHIQDISPTAIMRLANQYLTIAHFSHVMVG